MDFITLNQIKKILKHAKPNQPIEIAYRSKIAGKRSWEKENDESRMWKITRVNTVTNCNYADILAAKEVELGNSREDPAEVEKSKKASVAYTPIEGFHNMLYEYNNKYYLRLYPSTRWENSKKQYTLWDADDNCYAEYDTPKSLLEYMQPAQAAKYMAEKSPDFQMMDIQNIPLANIYEIHCE